MATAFRPICTTVKKWPGCCCSSSTRSALRLPSSASSLSLILRAAAREISDTEKKALAAISRRMMERLFARLTISPEQVLAPAANKTTRFARLNAWI
ncbi:Uncharacterised protein [Chromobacterium violaceum]|uniref:Uncharacterized protein n=1 Tax=Chromobacterium violaceum TaxID=536 RepID=A0A447TL51_CHRVL|nr:Uncharacterised protein [Chromobacterium violaceum]